MERPRIEAMGRILLLACVAASAQTWELRDGGTAASLRGVSAVDGQAVWVSGAKGTILHTADGGATWRNVSPAGASDLDFRDIEAIDERTAFAMSAGEGRASRLFKTTDGGANWTMLRANQDPAGFWDAISMWDATHGILLGDPVGGRFTILTTGDGINWNALEGPKAEKGEAAFAASGTALIVRGAREAWFASGGPGGGRVFYTEDAGRSWSATRTPIRPSSEGTGIFSIAVSGSSVVAVGGDYTKPGNTQSSIAISTAGKWSVPASPPGGYRSAVAYLPRQKVWIAVGTTGSDVSSDDGRTWRGFDDGAFNALSVAPDGAVWAVGPDGRIARLAFSEP